MDFDFRYSMDVYTPVRKDADRGLSRNWRVGMGGREKRVAFRYFPRNLLKIYSFVSSEADGP